MVESKKKSTSKDHFGGQFFKSCRIVMKERCSENPPCLNYFAEFHRKHFSFQEKLKKKINFLRTPRRIWGFLVRQNYYLQLFLETVYVRKAILVRYTYFIYLTFCNQHLNGFWWKFNQFCLGFQKLIWHNTTRFFHKPLIYHFEWPFHLHTYIWQNVKKKN